MESARPWQCWHILNCPRGGFRHGGIRHLVFEGLITLKEEGPTCCYAAQGKAWATALDGEQWEIDTVLARAGHFGATPDLLTEQPTAGCCAVDNAS